MAMAACTHLCARNPGAWGVLLSVFIGATALSAEPAQDTASRILLSFDNDIFVHHDNDYSNGVSIGWLSPVADDWHPGFAWAGKAVDGVPFFAVPGSRTATSLDLSQAMYTPTDLTLDPPDPDDRPYCGVLLATLGLHRLTERTLTSVDLSLGTVGDWSGAEATQSLVHTATGSERPEGWDHQIGNGILANLALERRWRTFAAGSPYDGFGCDVMIGGTGMFGNFRTSAIADVGVRIGYRMNSSYGTMSIRPGSEGRLLPTEAPSFWGCHVGLMAAGEAVAYDVTLDGRLFAEDEISVDKEPLLGRVALVFGGHVSRLQLYLLLIYSTPNFQQEDAGSTQYGRLIAVWTL